MVYSLVTVATNVVFSVRGRAMGETTRRNIARNISSKLNVRHESQKLEKKVERCFSSECFNVSAMFRAMIRLKSLILLSFIYSETLKHLILIEIKNREIEVLYKSCEKDGVMAVIKNLEKSVEDLLDSEELFWKQRSRADWLEGRPVDTEAGMAQVVREFFHSLFHCVLSYDIEYSSLLYRKKDLVVYSFYI